MAYKRDINVGMNDSEEKTQSRINAAGLINSTLERLWFDCYNAMAKGDLVIWNRKMDAIWNILGGDVKEDSEEDRKVTEINTQIYKSGSLNHKMRGFEKEPEEDGVNKAYQYLLLSKKGLYLRRLQNKQGKGTAYENEDEDDFD